MIEKITYSQDRKTAKMECNDGSIIVFEKMKCGTWRIKEHIIPLKREDAERLAFNILQSRKDAISKAE